MSLSYRGHRVERMAKTDEAASGDAALGYEQARDELIEVVRRLEAGGTTLEESLALWERGRSWPRCAGAGWRAPAPASTPP